MPVENPRIRRYRRRSLQLLQNAMDQMRDGRWSRTEDLIWGSLTLAVKGVALSRGEELDGDEAVKEYAQMLGHEKRDRRIREAFEQVGTFGETLDRVRESRTRVDEKRTKVENSSREWNIPWDGRISQGAPTTAAGPAEFGQ